MRIAIESTARFIGEDRLWIGITETGIPVSLLVAGVSPMIDDDDPRHEEFRRELIEVGRITAEHSRELGAEVRSEEP